MKLASSSERRRRRRRRGGSSLPSMNVDDDDDDAAGIPAAALIAAAADVDDSLLSPLLPTDFAHPAFDISAKKMTMDSNPYSWSSSSSSSPSLSASSSRSLHEDGSLKSSSRYSFSPSSSPCRADRQSRRLPVMAPKTTKYSVIRGRGDVSGDGRRIVGAGLSTRHRHAPAWWILVALMLYSSGIVGVPVVISSADELDTQQRQQQQQRFPKYQSYDRDYEWRQWNEVQRLQQPQHRGEASAVGKKSDKDYFFDQMKNEILSEKDSTTSKRYSVKVDDSSIKKNLQGGKSVNSLLRNNSSPVASRKLPQAIIIGVKKGGTRAFLEFLRFHPDVRAPGPEPHFFDKNYGLGLEWYRQLMPATLEGQLTIEKTPSYFVTRDVPAKIYDMSKSVKLIVVVRDPVNRAISDYTQSSSKRQGMKSFEELAFLNNVTGLIDTSWQAIKIGVYAKHLQRWLQFFPLSQFHFVDGENLIRNPGEEMIKVQDFLGLRRVISEKDFVFNSSKGFPCLKRPNHPQSPLKCLGKTKGRRHPHVDEFTLERLRDFFRPFNNKFFKMIGQYFDWPSSRT